MRCRFLPFCPRFPGRTQRFWCPGDLPGPPTPAPSQPHVPVVMFQLLKYLLDNQPTREGAKEKRGMRKRPCKDVVHPQRIWCWFMTSCAPARSGIAASASPVAPARSGISATSQQPGLAIPTRGLGTRGPSPASPGAGVQHLEHKAPSAGMVVCPCRAPRCGCAFGAC